MKHISIFLFLVFLSFTVKSQKWVNFSKNDNIRCSVMDEPFLWIGSNHGLLQYDIVMDTFRLYNASNSGLLENTIEAIAKDASGKLYIATLFEGLVTFENGEWEPVESVNEYLTEEYFMNYITDIYVEDNNVIWFTSSKGLFSLEGDDLVDYNSDDPDAYYYSVIKDGDDIWLGSNGLIRFDGENWEVFNSNNSNLPLGSYNDLKKDNNGNIWCTTSRHLIKNTNGIFESFESMVDGFFYSLTIEPNNDIYVGMRQSYYAFQKFQSNSWTSYDPSNCGIINENVFIVNHDSQNHKYFMGDKGLDILNSDEEWTFREISNSSLPNNYIRSMAIDENGSNAFCTSSGIIEYNWEEWSEGIDLEFISQIAYNQNGHLIMVTPQELHIFDGESLETIQTPYYGYIADQPVNALAIDTEGNIWMTFPDDIYNYMKGGVFMYDGTEWTIFTEENSDLPHHNITDILVDHENNLWFSTAAGLAKFDHSNWEVQNSSNSQLPHNYLHSVTQDSENKIWVSMAYDIVASYDGSSWTVYDSPTYPYTSDIKDIQFDSKGNLWGVGLSKVVKFNMEEWETFDMHNSPLPHNNTVSLNIDKNDNIFVGTSINGIYIFNEEGLDPVTKNNDLAFIEASQQIIHPNPTRGDVQIDLSAYSAEKDLEIKIYDIRGQEVYKSSYAYQSQLSINFPSNIKGVFLMKIVIGGKEIDQKLIVQ